MRAFAALVLAVLLPPFVVAATGGADLDLPSGLRVSWYEPLPVAIALLGAIVAAGLEPADARWRRALRIAALAAFATVGAVAWTGGIHGPHFRVTNALRPALLGVGALGLAALGTRARLRRRAWREVALGLGAGGLVTAGALAADARDLALRIAAPRAASAPGTDVIFVLVDTLRADFLGCYGAAPSPSPAIDALAARSVFFERAFAQASWTFPSVAALMTSRHPSRLGLLEPPDPTRGNGLPVVPDGPPRLAELLRARGFHTAAFYKNPFLEPGSGFERGFEVYEHVGGDGADGHSGGQLVSEALRWARALADARARGDQAPFFLYLHFMEPHIDYQPPAEFVPEEARAYRGPQDGSARKLHRARRGSGFTPADVAYLRAMYRGDVAYLDTQIARLREELTRLGLWRDDTLFVFTADHGEQFGEHGDWEHGDMHVENVHVPLFLHGPRLAARRVPDVVRLVDVTPTLLALEGLPPLADAEGRSLSPLLRGDALPTLPAVSELGWRWRVTDDPFSLVIEGDQHELYDLRADPGEKQDLAASDPATVARLRAFLDAHEAAGRSAAGGSGAAVGRPLDDRMREQLKALGYLGE